MFESLVPPPSQTKVMIVDDKPVNLELLEGYLEAEGYQTITATSGEEALEKIGTEKPAVVLLDVMMPGLDGFEVCRRIKNSPATVFLPVVLVTALKETGDRVKGAQAGADDFLSKPVDEHELIARVKSLIRIRALNDALEARNKQLKDMVRERTTQLEQATQELQKLLAEKAHFTPDLVPVMPTAEDTRADQPADAAVAANGEVSRADRIRFRKRILAQLSDGLEGRTDLSRSPEIVEMLGKQLATIYQGADLRLPDALRQQLFREIVDEIVGYGPLEPLLADPEVSEIMVNGPAVVYAERKGKLTRTDITFDDDDHVLRIIDRIIRPLGRRVDRKSPMVDARLPDGSRVNAVIAPCTIDGPSITIRKFSKEKLQVADLIRFGSMTEAMADFLAACVRARLNIVVSGGTGSGKTTLLNILSGFIPDGERITTIEDSAELQLHQDHVVRLEAQPPDLDGSGEVTIRDLVKNCLRMRPDRIVVGEVRGGEALDMLQAMNTGHDGSLTTVHANTPRDATGRLETLTLMSGLDLPLKVVRSQIASAVDLIVQQARLQDGARKIIAITEVQGMEMDVITLSDIFVFREEGFREGKVLGRMRPTGIRPKFSVRLEASGFPLRPEMFLDSAQVSPTGE